MTNRPGLQRATMCGQTVLLRLSALRPQLVEAGQAYYGRCKQILDDVADAECVVTGFSAGDQHLCDVCIA